MQLRDLISLSGLSSISSNECAQKASSLEISTLAYDSRNVDQNSLFVAIKGYSTDGHLYIDAAIAAGACALIVSEEIVRSDVPVYYVEDSRKALAQLSAAFYGFPSKKLKVIGVTGTNGKTTTTYLVDAILRDANIKTALVGTVEIQMDGKPFASERTTPESLELQELFASAVDLGIGAVTIEVSSHAIDLARVDETEFAAVAFTNISQDHLDFHNTMEDYFESKKKLFTNYDVNARVICTETPEGRDLYEELKPKYPVISVGRNPKDELFASDEIHLANSTEFTLNWRGESRAVRLPIPGAYNVENALVAAGIALSLGLDLKSIALSLTNAPQVPGRLERVDCGQPFVVAVDYAHTPDSIEKAISAMREVSKGKIIAVFGCGGDRDPLKRPKMAHAAAAADFAIATSDNPRTEDPAKILEEVEIGFHGGSTPYEVIVSRREAIGRAVQVAHDDDVILILGKGHENYQIFAEGTVHFDDREEAASALTKRGFCK